MIPASYLFRSIYRDHFEEQEPRQADPPLIRGRLSLDRVTAAILGFAYGAGHLTLGASPTARHERRR
ncbi:hypothetical protein LB518_23635 [Mesorhizobium sp. BR1-1-16]|uniref:hypothetical protein n=1 Tax=Mesorhizobium sp. BR1-1-16 TaxID=2876653 RepID=UPI001CCEA908|nr:hypothetical protein [Mesorhizobium sp. BR1-1-16]MBZ9939304.1 hypothetical protein [Mesorhizobium sp. BR1-1-16]